MSSNFSILYHFVQRFNMNIIVLEYSYLCGNIFQSRIVWLIVKVPFFASYRPCMFLRVYSSTKHFLATLKQPCSSYKILLLNKRTYVSASVLSQNKKIIGIRLRVK